ncbi:RNA polymerase sigma factor [Tautonia marina]|uniref:RNA polymerase sigma factor n=1 Tax=Tautonia marina TaxID=2653855 RepID=UPI0012607DAF|nr:RNA polymerase sigma factor [Tautonia marina]
MPRAMNEASLRHLGTLFGGGSGLGMSDGQLLERFVTREGTRAERAFEILVERHGPMVQRVARSIVSDRDLADDAFQTVFVTLAKRARSLWVRDSIGPWLHAVTVRVATRMRNDQARRRRIDAKAAALMPSSFEPGVPDDLGAALHEEIARLPEAQRLAIVLCLVEGLTHDQAADRLGWPVGTIRSRLARGRERLRSRLDRRGLAPSSGVLIGPGLLMRSGSEAIRGSLLHATVQNAVSATHGGAIGLVGTVPAGAIAAAVTLVKESSMIHRVLVVGLMSAGVFAAGASISAQSKPEPSPATVTGGIADEGRMVTRTYSVPDLIAFNHLVRGYHQEGPGPRLTQITRSADFEPLIELLTSSVAPDSWTITRFPGEEVPPGDTLPDGVLIPLPSTSKMVIRHTAEVHDEVRTRLEQIRRLVTALKNPPEVVEERIIGPEPTEVEIVEERIIGPESSPFELDRAREGEARSSDPFIPTPDQRSPFELTPDQRNPFEQRPTAGPTPDQRIESLERKLDAILDELRAIRGGEKPEGVQGEDNSD